MAGASAAAPRVRKRDEVFFCWQNLFARFASLFLGGMMVLLIRLDGGMDPCRRATAMSAEELLRCMARTD